MGTDEFDGVLLRIAVQSRPTGAANPESFGMLPVHGIGPPGIHVLKRLMRGKAYLLQGGKYLNLQTLSDCVYRLGGGSQLSRAENDLINK